METDDTLRVSPLYQMSLEYLIYLKEYLTENLKRGWIELFIVPYVAPILFVKKPNGGWRFYIDYRRLNNIIKKDRYPLPLINETLTRLSRIKIFTKLDIR